MIALNRIQERGIILADVVILGAIPVIFGRPVIMADGYFRKAPLLCFIERLGRLVGVTLRLHRAPRFLFPCRTFGPSRLLPTER